MISCSESPCSNSLTRKVLSTRRSATTGRTRAAMQRLEQHIPWSSYSCSIFAASGRAAPSTAQTSPMKSSRPFSRCGQISHAAATRRQTRSNGRHTRPTTRTSWSSPDRVTDLLVDQYKAVLPLVGYYQFMDKFFTPCYLLDIVAAREQNS